MTGIYGDTNAASYYNQLINELPQIKVALAPTKLYTSEHCVHKRQNPYRKLVAVARRQ